MNYFYLIQEFIYGKKLSNWKIIWYEIIKKKIKYIKRFTIYLRYKHELTNYDKYNYPFNIKKNKIIYHYNFKVESTIIALILYFFIHLITLLTLWKLLLFDNNIA